MRFSNPSENRKYYQEQLALLVLKSAYSERFSGLQHVGQNKSPDLQDVDSSIGIEVATAFTKRESLFYYEKFSGQQLHKDSKVIQRMRETNDIFGYDEEGRVYCLYPDAFLILSPEQASEKAGQPIIDIGRKKVDKLNDGHYDRFRTNGLFIFVDNGASSTTIRRNASIIIEHQKEKVMSYDELYLLKYDTLYTFNDDGIVINIFYLQRIGDLYLQAKEIVGVEQ